MEFAWHQLHIPRAPRRHISTSIQSAVLTWMCGDIHHAKSKPLFNIIESFGLAVLHSVCLRVLLINAGSGSSGSSDEWLQREAGSWLGLSAVGGECSAVTHGGPVWWESSTAWNGTMSPDDKWNFWHMLLEWIVGSSAGSCGHIDLLHRLTVDTVQLPQCFLSISSGLCDCRQTTPPQTLKRLQRLVTAVYSLLKWHGACNEIK